MHVKKFYGNNMALSIPSNLNNVLILTLPNDIWWKGRGVENKSNLNKSISRPFSRFLLEIQIFILRFRNVFIFSKSKFDILKCLEISKTSGGKQNYWSK